MCRVATPFYQLPAYHAYFFAQFIVPYHVVCPLSLRCIQNLQEAVFLFTLLLILALKKIFFVPTPEKLYLHNTKICDRLVV